MSKLVVSSISWLLLLGGVFGFFCGLGGLLLLAKLPSESIFYVARGSSFVGSVIFTVVSSTLIWLGWKLRRVSRVEE